MYKSEKSELRDIINKSSGNKAYEIVKKKVDEWGEQTAKRVCQELQRDYEIGVPIDKLTEVATLCIAFFSMLISCIALVTGENDQGSICVVVIVTVGCIVLLCLGVLLIQLAYSRKREIKAAIDVLNSFLE